MLRVVFPLVTGMILRPAGMLKMSTMVDFELELIQAAVGDMNDAGGRTKAQGPMQGPPKQGTVGQSG